MNLYNEKISSIVAMIGTLFTWLFGGWDLSLTILIVFMTIDYITGILRGFVTKKLSSNVGLIGIARKSVILIVLIVAALLDRLINDNQFIFRTLVCYFYIANEGLSILENCSAIGIPMHPKIKEALEQLRDGNKKSIEEKSDKQDNRDSL